MELVDIHNPDNEHYRSLKKFIEENRETPGPLIQVLHKAQEIFGYLPVEVQYFIAREMDVSYSEVYGVVTFYNFFRTEPIGDHIINVCLGTACHVKGAQEIIKSLQKELELKVGGTTKDRFFTLSTARCCGACGLAPVMLIDDEVYGRLNPQKAVQIIQQFKQENQEN